MSVLCPLATTNPSTGVASRHFLAGKARHLRAFSFFTNHFNVKPLLSHLLALEVLVFVRKIHANKLLLHFLESARYSMRNPC